MFETECRVPLKQQKQQFALGEHFEFEIIPKIPGVAGP